MRLRARRFLHSRSASASASRDDACPPEAPATLTYDRTTRRFSFPSNDYWRGGKLNVYEVYRAWNY